MPDLAHARETMVERQVAGRGIDDPGVLAAMREVPREAFVAERFRNLAYDDQPLPIEAGQTISQPFIVALMIAAAELGPTDRVLEVGAGSGYAAAVMSRIVAQVYGVERHAELTALAQERLQRLGYDNVALMFLRKATAAVSSARMNRSLYDGFTGVAWAVAHLRQRLLDPEDRRNDLEARPARF